MSTSTLGRSASAAYLSGCGAQGSSNDQWLGDGSSSRGSGSSQSTSQCQNVVVATAAGASATGGWRSSCYGYTDWEYRSDGENYNGVSEGRNHCRDGLIVEGPTGIAIFVGHVSESEWSCWHSGGEYACGDGSWSLVGAEVGWAQNPLGPGGHGVFTYVP